MANNNPTELDIQNAFCKCGKVFAINAILKHLTKNEDCNDKFSVEELKNLKERSKSFSKLKKKINSATNYQKNKLLFKAKNEKYTRQNETKINANQKIYDDKNKTKINAKKKIYYEKNKTQINAQRKIYYEKNKIEITSKNREKKTEHSNFLFKNPDIQIKNWNRDRMWGPVFPCSICEKILFKRSVNKIDDKLMKCFDKFKIHDYANWEDIQLVQGSYWICHNCETYVSKGKMPPTCSKNGLGITNPPRELINLTLLERQMIQKNMPFLKIRRRPRTRMPALNDRVINIPIGDTDLIKNAMALPRTANQIGLISLKIKRKLNYQTHHRLECMRPQKVNEALKCLSSMHPQYKDIEINLLEEHTEWQDLHSDHSDDSIQSENDASMSSETNEVFILLYFTH